MLLEQLLREFTLAWRRIRTSPGPAVFAVVTLALGIGVTVATYSVVYSGLWRPLGVADESRLVLVGASNSQRPGARDIGWKDYEGLVREQRGFADVAGWRSFSGVLSGQGTAELIRGEVVTGSYFRMLGVAATTGRVIGPDDDRSDAAPVVVLAHSTWRDQFGADPAIVGKTIKVLNLSFEVIGVAPPGFRGVHSDGFAVRAAWVPLAFAPRLSRDLENLFNPGRAYLTVGLRLGPTQTLQSAAAEVTRVGQQLADADYATFLDAIPGRRADASLPPRVFANWTTALTTDDQSTNEDDAMGRLIVGLPALVLLIACTNIANLVLSRGSSRRQDFGVRRALGASRWRLIREQLVEQAAIVSIGGAGGVLIAYVLVRVAASIARENLAAFIPASQFDWSLDAAVLTSTGGAMLLSILVFGLLPALHLTRDSLRSVMDQGSTASTLRWRGRGNLIAVQLGVSVGLFLIAIVFVRMLLSDSMLGRPGGPKAAGLDGIAVAQVGFDIQQRGEAAGRVTVDRILAELRQTPGLSAVAVTSGLPVQRWPGFIDATVNLPGQPFVRGQRGGSVQQFMAASPAIFEVLDKRIVSGRMFDARDTSEAPPVAIVDEDLAKDVFGATDVVGREIVVRIQNRWQRAPLNQRDVAMTVVGVVPAGQVPGQRGRASELYVPFAQQYSPVVGIVARGTNGEAPVDLLRASIKRADADLAVTFVTSAETLANGPLAFVGYIATTLICLAVLALGLAMTGLYGVLSHVMARRTREMGIRMAVGASKTQIVTLVLRDGFRPIIEGLFIGLATATVVRFYLRTAMMAEEIAPLDPVACVLAAILVTIAGWLACYLPAKRAATVDPNVALRQL